MKAIVVSNHGGPESLEYVDAPDPVPGVGQALVRVEAIGVNFIDVYHRTGLYAITPPFIPGSECVGTVEAVGPGVTEVQVGDRVGQALARGSYAELQAIDAWRLVRLPGDVDAEAGAALMLQGMTAHYLAKSTFPLRAGHRALVHAAAGGVGLLLVQIASRLGAVVYGTVSTPAKAELAREAGANDVILYTEQDFRAEIMRLTENRGVDVVYDSVGQATFEGSLNSLKPRGYLVAFGQSSGPVGPFDPLLLSAKGSLFLTRATLVNYAASREEIASRAADLFTWYTSGDLKLRIHERYPLKDAAEAHRALEGRRTTGKLLLVP